jgi:hypothetical protein
MRKKGQAAMEYLMTYGWAILIIIVVIGALWKMGVFKTTGAVPCSPCFGYFAYVDHGGGTLIVRNGGLQINVTTVTGGTLTGGTNQIFNPGEDLTLTGVATTGDVDVQVDYINTDSGLSKTDTATIHN